MVSQMAKDDIDSLRAEGLDLTVDEIVRLNAFGLRVEKGPESAELYTLPRAAVLGEVVFHEPTLSSDIWLREAGRIFNLEEYDTYTQLRALSMSNEDLPDATDKKNVVKSVESLLGKLSQFTRRQLENALLYCIDGNLDKAGERQPKSKSQQKDDESEYEDLSDFCFELGVLNDGILLELGTPSELKGMTQSQLLALIQYKKMMKYGQDKKNTDAQNLGKYYAVLEEIKEQAMKRKQNV